MIKSRIHSAMRDIEHMPTFDGICTLFAMLFPGVTLVYSDSHALSFFGLLWIVGLGLLTLTYQLGYLKPRNINES